MGVRLWPVVGGLSLALAAGLIGMGRKSPEDKMARYGKAAQKRVQSAMRRRKKGTLKSSSGATVKSRKQAIAIGLSEAREKGAKVPRPSQRVSQRRKK